MAYSIKFAMMAAFLQSLKPGRMRRVRMIDINHTREDCNELATHHRSVRDRRIGSSVAAPRSRRSKVDQGSNPRNLGYRLSNPDDEGWQHTPSDWNESEGRERIHA
jgi:hypothetical protein